MTHKWKRVGTKSLKAKQLSKVSVPHFSTSCAYFSLGVAWMAPPSAGYVGPTLPFTRFRICRHALLYTVQACTRCWLLICWGGPIPADEPSYQSMISPRDTFFIWWIWIRFQPLDPWIPPWKKLTGAHQLQIQRLGDILQHARCIEYFRYLKGLVKQKNGQNFSSFVSSQPPACQLYRFNQGKKDKTGVLIFPRWGVPD